MIMPPDTVRNPHGCARNVTLEHWVREACCSGRNFDSLTAHSSAPAEWVLLWIDFSDRTIGTRVLKSPPPGEIQRLWLLSEVERFQSSDLILVTLVTVCTSATQEQGKQRMRTRRQGATRRGGSGRRRAYLPLYRSRTSGAN